MKTLILGASGFLGSNLSAHLVRQGAAVRGIGRHLRYAEPLEGVDFEERILRPDDRFERLLDGVDVVFNVVGVSAIESAEGDPEGDSAMSVRFTRTLLDACRSAGVRRVVMASSGGAVYGPYPSAIPEGAARHPISLYGIHRVEAEDELVRFNEQYGMRNIILRLANPFGPYQHNEYGQGAILIFARRLLSSEPVTLFAEGRTRRDFIYIEDVANAFANAARYEGSRRIFNIGSGRARATMDVLRTIERAMGKKAEVQFAPNPNHHVPVNILDNRLATRELEWKPQTSFELGIDLTIEWLETQMDTARSGKR